MLILQYQPQLYRISASGYQTLTNSLRRLIPFMGIEISFSLPLIYIQISIRSTLVKFETNSSSITDIVMSYGTMGEAEKCDVELEDQDKSAEEAISSLT